jgi:hypothetical protein
MAKHVNAGKTVAEILKRKRATIKDAPLDEGSPSWDDILDLTWEELKRRAARGEPGFRTFKKLLERRRFNK